MFGSLFGKKPPAAPGSGVPAFRGRSWDYATGTQSVPVQDDGRILRLSQQSGFFETWSDWHLATLEACKLATGVWVKHGQGAPGDKNQLMMQTFSEMNSLFSSSVSDVAVQQKLVSPADGVLLAIAHGHLTMTFQGATYRSPESLEHMRLLLSLSNNFQDFSSRPFQVAQALELQWRMEPLSPPTALTAAIFGLHQTAILYKAEGALKSSLDHMKQGAKIMGI